jgi:hypothetical protein
MARRSTERVIVFIDWQNVYKGAPDAIHQGQGSRLLNVEPLRLAQRLIELPGPRRGRRRGCGSRGEAVVPLPPCGRLS